MASVGALHSLRSFRRRLPWALGALPTSFASPGVKKAKFQIPKLVMLDSKIMKWKSGHNEEMCWLQYLNDDESFAALSFIRTKEIRWVQILLQELPEELKSGPETMCSYSLQDYNGDEYSYVQSTGFLKDNTLGNRIFTSGQSEFDDDLEPYRSVINNIVGQFVLEISGHERIFSIDKQALEDLRAIYED